jgi:hypothetical protein
VARLWTENLIESWIIRDLKLNKEVSMAYGNWDDVITSYETIYLKSNVSEHAKGILKLIPEIRDYFLHDGLIPGTTHSTLFLEIPNSITRILVWCEGDDKYTIYYSHPEKGSYEYITVDFSDVIQTIRNYIDTI